LAALDHAVHEGELDPLAVAGRLGTAAAISRPLRTRSSSQAVAAAAWELEQEAAPLLSAELQADSPLARTAGMLLRQVGLDIRAHPGLARRLTATLDVAVNHWLDGAERGGGLPTGICSGCWPVPIPAEVATAKHRGNADSRIGHPVCG